MKTSNPIIGLLPAGMVDMGGMPVRQPFPTKNVEQIDPFLLLHHHAGKIKGDQRPKDVGIGPHPHRGFSPVTFIFEGDVHHRDSRGNSSIVDAGGVQWMDAGMGIIHSERPSAKLAMEGGLQEIIQLWVNLPSDKKMVQPHYQAINRSDKPVVDLVDGKGKAFLVSGELAGARGPVDSKLPVTAVMGEVEDGDVLNLSKPADWNGFFYFLDGRVKLDGFGIIDAKTVANLNPEATTFPLSIQEKSRFIFLAAPALNEKVSQYGPFVMNTQTEVMEAIRDYQQGKMGVLIEDFD